MTLRDVALRGKAERLLRESPSRSVVTDGILGGGVGCCETRISSVYCCSLEVGKSRSRHKGPTR